jgi:tetratricopeptide (TPR) repeat protein
VAIKYNPGLFQAYFSRGECKYYMESYQGAVDDLNTAIELNPGLHFARLWRGKAKKILGDDKGAA